ncbi:MAG TPA: type IV pilus assembly protein PilM [Gemmatimonadota bacterium]|nr:type IV pilus assembly protein PilM [Gemmatimonadota bacterium]
MILRKSRNNLAIDLGSSHIKILVLEGEGPKARIAALGVEPLPADAIVAGEIMDYHLVVDSLKKLRDRVGQRIRLRGRPVATSVSGRDVIVKRIKMDRMQEGEARQVIRWEAEQHVPFDMDSVSLDFEILDPDADGLQMEVLLVAAKRDLVETRMRLLGEAGFETAIIDIDAFAVQTAFEHNYEHAAYGTFCLVNIGRETTNLSLVESGRPLLTRDIAVGERKFVEALVEALDATVEDAERRLQQWDTLDHGARQALDDAIDSVVTPIERARGFLTASEGDKREIDEVVLSGGGAAIPGLQAAIADRLNVEVTMLDPLKMVEMGPDPGDVAAGPAGRAALAVAVGLALRGRR